MAEFYLLANTTPSQMFGCVIKTETKTIVFDGGTVGDSAQLDAFLRKNAVSHVDAWFFTHPHHDHIGCFCELTQTAKDIKIENIYHAFPPIDELKKRNPRVDLETKLWESIDTWDKYGKVHKLSRGDVFTFDGVTVRVLRIYKEGINENFINNSSAVYRIENTATGKSILLLGDLGTEGGEEVMKECPRELLCADYTQMAHHGQNGVSREFYEYIAPKRCIWAAPDWLWDNNVGTGFDKGPFNTVRTREWMSALGVTEHYIEKDGIQKIEF